MNPSPANVGAIEPKGEKNAILVMTDGTRIWTPDRESANALIGKPIPPDWKHKQGEYGPQVFPPGKDRPQTAWRNTKEGAEYENASRQRWQQVEEERKDRRTALMQAAEHFDGVPSHVVLLKADEFYEWLRTSRGVEGGALGKAPTAPRETTSPSAQDTAEHSAEVQAGGEEHSGVGQAPAEAAVGGNESFLPESSKPPGRRYQFSVKACSHEFPATEDARCSGCGSPLARLEATA